MAKQRLSNIELLRLLAMFMIMIVHGNFGALDAPTVSDLSNNPLGSFARIELESLSIVCVNVFVLISGWFGIRPTLKSIGSFLFQILFFYIGIYGIAILMGKDSLTMTGLSHTFLLSPIDYFIKGYLYLCILAPALNAFVEHASQSTQKKVLVWFFLFQTLFGWMTKGASFMLNGYSAACFIGLYLLARYVKTFHSLIFCKNKWFDLCIYLACTLGITIGCYIAIITGLKAGLIVYSYTCPLNIMAALFFLLFFSKLNIQSKLINWMAASSFAVYLFHRQFTVFEFFQNGIRSIFGNNEPYHGCTFFIFF